MSKIQPSKDITLQEVFESPLFRTNFYKELQHIEQKRSSILRVNPGVKFKASVYSTLQSKNLLTTEFLVTEFMLIQSKQSKLSSNEREWISQFIRQVATQTLFAWPQKAAVKKRKTNAL